eukprot:scaffold231712_cov33-Prasinocladus_malaysianus.AAC.1
MVANHHSSSAAVQQHTLGTRNPLLLHYLTAHSRNGQAGVISLSPIISAAALSLRDRFPRSYISDDGQLSVHLD